MADRLEPAGLDMKDALEAVKKAGTPIAGAGETPGGEESEGKTVKFVNLRFREADYKRIGRLAVTASMTKAAFCKMASLYVAEMAATGGVSISGGVLSKSKDWVQPRPAMTCLWANNPGRGKRSGFRAVRRAWQIGEEYNKVKKGMEATYRLKPYELTDGFLNMVKEAFYDKEITITIEEACDETAYLLRSEANRKLLLAGVEAVKQGKTVHTMTLEEAEALGT